MDNFKQQIGIERKKHPARMLKDKLGKLSQDINIEIENEYQLSNLLKSDASLDPSGYKEIYDEETLTNNANEVHKCELDFSGALNPGVQEYYKSAFGAQTEEQIIAKWKENIENEKNGQMEMAITALLSQKLGKDFLIVRTAPFDDYKNGVDTLIIDRVTGEVVGAFDEVHESGGGKYTKAKEEKIRKIAAKGGAEIQYGLKLINNKLVRASLQNVPVFYLGLEKLELEELVEGLDSNNKEKTDKIFKKLLSSLSIQYDLLKKCKNKPEFTTQLNSFDRSLSRMIDSVEGRNV